MGSGKRQPGWNVRSVRGRVAMSLAAAMLAGAVGGCHPEADRLHRLGVEDFKRGDYLGAIGKFEAAVEAWPEHADSEYFLGRCYLELAKQALVEGDAVSAQGLLERARFHYGNAITCDPGHTAAVKEQAYAMALAGEIEESVDLVRWHAEAEGYEPDSLLAMAEHYEQIGRPEEALRCYRQAVAVGPREWRAYAALGRFYARMGKTRLARVFLERAYALNPLEESILKDLDALGDESAPPAVRPGSAAASQSGER